MENKKIQYQAAGMLHQLQATINMIPVHVAGRACEIWLMHKSQILSCL